MSEPIQIQEFACTGPINVSVRCAAGAVTVAAEETAAARVRISPYDDSDASREAATHTVVEFVAGTLRIQTPQNTGWLRRNGRVRVDVAVPVDSVLRVGVGSADVRTEGRLGEAEVQSGSGDAEVRNIAGDLRVESGSGDVRAGNVGGALRVKTGSGDVHATVVGGPASVKVGSGDVRLDEVRGPVQATSASGDIGIGAARTGEVRINSASGDVSVGVPVGTGVWLDLSTVSGSTSSDLEMTGGAVPDGGAALNLSVNTVSGDIRVHRVAA